MMNHRELAHVARKENCSVTDVAVVVEVGISTASVLHIFTECLRERGGMQKVDSVSAECIWGR
jgi:hypothetical protein